LSDTPGAAPGGPPTRLALVGCTASGKSSVALQVATELGDLEIVTVDSMQVYRGMDIGTAKPTPAEQRAVPHHLLDLVDPADEFTVSEFQAAARQAIDDIEARGRRALLVGGTGLYLRAVVDDLVIPGQFPVVRAELEAEPDTASLHERLRVLDPLAASRMEPSNRRRVVRALEVTLGSGRPFSSFGPGLEAYPSTAFDLVGIDRPVDVLNERVAARYREQVAAGFVDEVRALAEAPGGLGRTASQALGYAELLAVVRGELDLDAALELAITRTRRFARRQRSWFRRDPRVTWLEVGADAAPVVAALVRRWAR
jgi:tRNA dimethylallyltransferase